MIVWGFLLGTLGFNFHQHKHGRPTLCSKGREHIGPVLFVTLWLALSSWIIPHYCLGFLKVDLDRLTD